MQLGIELTSKIADFESKIILIKEIESLKLELNEQEYGYVQQRIDDKKEVIIINRYTTQLIIIFIKDQEQNKKREDVRKHGAKSHIICQEHKIEVIGLLDYANDEDILLAFIEGFILGSYSFNKYKTNKEEEKIVLSALKINSTAISREKIDELENVCKGVFLARDLINEPVLYLNSIKFAEITKQKASDAGFKATVLGKEEIEKLNMGGLLAINKGSIDPPRFIILEWNPSQAKNTKPYVLVGKGIVYDTGGLSLKTGGHMEDMKCDMSGGAAVLGTFYALATNKINVHVIGLIPVTDNRPDGNAITPGDIVKMYNGKTVEILNTDAEGRMILADALSYADQYNPELVIDIATLTGSASVAIGKFAMVCMGNAERPVFSKLQESANRVHERMVEFPFYEDYNEQLKSPIADLKNIGGREAGAITAGKFLENFTKSPYIHLDIAGVAYSKEKDGYRPKGGLGTGVRLFYDFIKNC